MNFLRARVSVRGWDIDNEPSPHLLLAFADDCTGLLADIDHAPEFINVVQDYALASGLHLNMNKTCVMPLTHQVDLSKLARLRASTNLKVLKPSDTVVLLGVLQGATVTPKQRISVTSNTPNLLKTVDVITCNFVHSTDTDSDSAVAEEFAKEWIYACVSKGGLGLTPVKANIQAMHLKTLKDGIASTCELSIVPRWFTPALQLFTRKLGSVGTGFDILYAHMKGEQWNKLPDYGKSTLRVWAELHTTHDSTNWKWFVQVIPLWYNVYFTFGKAKTPLAEVSKSTIGY
ncbi:Reverse transcriptase domain [Plasmopara halstedii]|uniref:Reverse transcriptase domain n=1 Tax=Plasmopara halstedii TaxID=4781 RepID=A0A0P1B1U3_PLAHL|nr:Reverse transcriptase domain [Plasmopara halstedii]CEG47527.1 Reverse transcriptase domain [Plasmopara halstedii]|eukprot:XP_024583896.1 Reverse transcriptase domain [Plasmopara halstedii]